MATALADEVWRVVGIQHFMKYVPCILMECLHLAYEVILHMAGITQGCHRGPMGIPLSIFSVNVDDVLHKLYKRHVVALAQGLLGGIWPEATNNLPTDILFIWTTIWRLNNKFVHVG